MYDKKSKDVAAFVGQDNIKKFVEETGVIYEEGCALIDSRLENAIKKVI